MADETNQASKNEIQELLDQAQAVGAANAANATTQTATPNPVAADASAGVESVGDDINLLLNQAERALDSIDTPPQAAVEGLSAFTYRDLSGEPANTEKTTLELLRDVELDVRIELGRTNMLFEDVLKLKRGSVVPLDKLAGDPVDVFVNGRLVARGEVLVMNDNFCVRVGELIASNEDA